MCQDLFMNKSFLVGIILLFGAATSAVCDTFNKDGIEYLTTCDSTVAVIKVYDHRYIVIPEKIIHENRSYKVTEIGSEAFYCAFNVSVVKIPGTVKEIRKNAFVYCKNISDIYVDAKEPPACAKEAFYMTPPSAITLHVPNKSKEAYASSETWREMKQPVKKKR